MNSAKQSIETEGGANISGNVDINGGDFIGRDKNIFINLHDQNSFPTSVMEYLDGRLRLFQKEEELGVALSGDAQFVTRLDTYNEIFLQEQHTSTSRTYNSINNIIGEISQFVLLGEPGSGKTTSLRKLATLIIRAKRFPHDDFSKALPKFITEGQTVPLPLWIELGADDNPIDAHVLFQYWWERYGLPGSIKTALDNLSVWLFCDGLNEMSGNISVRKQKIESLRNFIESHSAVPLIFTCRISDYSNGFNLGNLPIIRLRGLSNTQIKTYVEKRLKVNRNVDEFINMLESQINLKSLARNPHTLALLTDVYDKYGQLPANERALYRIFFELRYNEYHKRKLVKQNYSVLIKSFENLAYRMIIQGKGTTAQKSWVIQKMGRKHFEDGINFGLLVYDDQTFTVKFYHQSFQEYFALPGVGKDLYRAGSGEKVARFFRGLFFAFIWFWCILLSNLVPYSSSYALALIGLMLFSISSLFIVPWLSSIYLRRFIYRAHELEDLLKICTSILLTALNEPDEVIRRKTLDTLSNVYDQKYINVENTTFVENRQKVIHIVQTSMWKDSSRYVQVAAARSLWSISRHSSVETALLMLEESLQIYSVGRWEAPQIYANKSVLEQSTFLTDLNDPLLLRCEILNLWTRIGNPTATEMCIKGLYDSELSIKVKAAESLGIIGDTSALPHLWKARPNLWKLLFDFVLSLNLFYQIRLFATLWYAILRIGISKSIQKLRKATRGSVEPEIIQSFLNTGQTHHFYGKNQGGTTELEVAASVANPKELESLDKIEYWNAPVISDEYIAMKSPIATRILISVNILFFIAMIAYGILVFSDWNGSQNAYVLVIFGAKVNQLIIQGDIWRLLTANYIHIGLFHLVFNLYMLNIVGRLMEGYYGHSGFLIVYILGGLYGSLASFMFSDALSVGASGAIYAITVATIIYFFYYRRNFGQRGRAIMQNLIFLVAINIFAGMSTSGIDNWGNLGGLIGGAIIALGLLPHYEQVGNMKLEPKPLVVKRQLIKKCCWLTFCAVVWILLLQWAIKFYLG